MSNKKVLLIFGWIILFLGVLVANISSSKSEKYKESNYNDDESVYEEIVRQAGAVKDDERKELTEINIDDYMEIYNGDTEKLVLFSRPTCQYCKIATPILENIVYKYDVEINYLNTDNLSSDDDSKLLKSNEYFSDGYRTPLLLVIGTGKIVDQIEGVVTRDEYIEFMKQYKFMEE